MQKEVLVLVCTGLGTLFRVEHCRLLGHHWVVTIGCCRSAVVGVVLRNGALSSPMVCLVLVPLFQKHASGSWSHGVVLFYGGADGLDKVDYQCRSLFLLLVVVYPLVYAA